MAKDTHTPVILNRKAGFEYHIEQRFTAGLVLTGSEVKSLRAGNANISDAYAYAENNQIYVRNMHISEWKNAAHYNHDPLRIRKLMLEKSEIKKIVERLKEQGVTLIPLKVFFSDTGYAKMELGLGRGKKLFDKRDDIKKRDVEREMRRNTD